MNDISNIIISLIFLAFAVLFAIRFIKTRRKVTIKNQQPKMLIYLIAILAILMIISIVITYQTNTIMDYLRLALALIVIIMFYLVRDGLGNDGISVNGAYYTWDDINGWDYAKDDKGTYIYFMANSQKRDKNGKITPKMIFFGKEEGEEAISLLKNKVPKKYKRMRK